MNQRYKNAFFSVLAVLIAFIISGLLMLASNVNPLTAYYWLFYGAFVGGPNVALTLQLSIPLILTGLSVTVAFWSGFFNVGSEGQLFIGALFGTQAGLSTGFLPFPIPMIAVLLGGCFGGVVWCLGPALMKLRLGVNEIVSTLMTNFVAVFLVLYLVSGPMRNPGDPFNESRFLSGAARIPMVPGTAVNAGLLIALVSVVVVYLIGYRMMLGRDIKAVGLNAQASRYSGINATRMVLMSAIISGALAGLAGAVDVAGVYGTLRTDISPSFGYGYQGIPIALLGSLNPLGTLLAGVLFAALTTGSTLMQTVTHIPSTFIQFVIGVIVMTVVGKEVLQRARR